MTEMTAENLVPFKLAGVITLDWLKEFARVSGDHNPIHQDESVAKAMGLPGVIAHGMLISSLIHSRALEAIMDYRELRGFHIASSKTRFKAMTLLGDEVSVGGHWEVTGANEIQFELQAHNQRDELTVTTFFVLKR
jgi:acyl dehydratase